MSVARLRGAVVALLVAFASVAVVLPANAATTPAPRSLSLLINPRTSGSTPTYADYVDAAYKMLETGATGLFQSDNWSDLEPSQGTFTVDSLTSVLDTTPQQQILVNLKVIDTTNKSTPAFLQTAAFNSPAMLAEFHALVDRVAPHFGTQVKYVAVGNEVDVYLSQHPEQWGAYTAFFKDAVSYLHKVAPKVLVGYSATYDGFVGGYAPQLLTLNAAADVMIATYYPIDAHFVPRAPAVALTELPQLASLAGSKPLLIQEVGYPSSPVLGSSEQAQAQFFTNVFQVWRTIGSSRMPFVNFVSLHDTTASICDMYASYYGVYMLGLDVINWKAYFCSLGLRRSDGIAKTGWNAFLTQSVL